MPKFLIDVNLPYYFALWMGEEFIHQQNLDDAAKDSAIWEYAKAHELTIISKDSDFAHKMLLATPPPRVIHIKLGNLKMKDFHAHLTRYWPEILEMSSRHKLVSVFHERIEGIN